MSHAGDGYGGLDDARSRHSSASDGSRGGRGAPASAQALAKELNRQIMQANTIQEMAHAVLPNFSRMNTLNHCTAYHRLARHVQDQRAPPEQWPQAQQQQLGGLLTELNRVLLERVGEVQGQNLGLTLWALSKMYRVPQQLWQELLAALMAEITARLATVTYDTYMTDKQYKVGAPALANIIYSCGSMGLKPDGDLYAMLHAVGRAVVWQVADFKPQGLANIVWALGKMGAKKQSQGMEQLMEAVCTEMLGQLTHSRHKGSFAPQNISNTLHGFANMIYELRPDLLNALVGCADGMLLSFGPQELTNIVWSISQMKLASLPVTPEAEALLDRIADDLQLLFSDRSWRARVKPQTISNLLWAYAKMGRQPQRLALDLARESLALLPQFKPQELSNLLYAFGLMDFYPGHNTVDAITRAVGGAIDRLKPQEIANIASAYAHLRYFPGAALLDHMLACAESKVDRFKSQELAQLVWAMARLAYMPAASFARVALAQVEAWHKPAMQDCGNVLWACCILGILTPDIMRLLGGMLAEAMGREAPTQEAYIQLYQAKMALSQRVPNIAHFIPPAVLAHAEIEYRQQSQQSKISKLHRDVAEVLSHLQMPHELEKRIEDGLFSVDIALTDRMVAVEVDGNSHFSQNPPYVPQGKSIFRWRLLASRGWKVVTVPYYTWNALKTADARRQYLWRLLQCDGVWECLSVDPNNRDAAFCPPANLAHLTPEEVFEYAEAHIAPSSLLPSSASSSSTPAAASPVVFGLTLSPSSTTFTPAAGLHRPLSSSSSGGGGSSLPFGSHVLLPPGFAGARPGSSGGGAVLPHNILPLPIPLGDSSRLGQAEGCPSGPAAAAAAAAAGYDRLPDNLYSSDSPRSSSSAAGGGGGGGSGGGGGLNVSARPFSFGPTSGAGSPTGAYPAFAASSNRGYSISSGGGSGDGGTFGQPRAAATATAALISTPAGSSRLQPIAPPASSTFGSYSSTASLAVSPPTFSPLAPPGLELRSTAAHLRRTASSGGGSSSSTSASPSLPPGSGLRAQALLAPQLQQQRQPVPCLLPPEGQQRQQGSSPTAVAAGLNSRRPSSTPSAATGSVRLPGGSDDGSDDDIGDLRSFYNKLITPAQPEQPPGPLSVEEVQRKLAWLPADVAVADVAESWLADWDSARVAQLLRQLDSPITAARAVQLFEWLRGLAPDSQQAHLCTPATYAAMIDLYGRWKKPKPAVRLFAELKERGEDGPEVHSALVEAFCRSGQQDVALDAYRNMLALGLPPSPATCRAVLEVHVAHGSWEEADVVLARMVGQLLEGEEAPDQELFTSVIERACAAGNPAAAQSAYNHMCQAGVPPTPATFAALVAALRRQRPAREVAELAAEMAEQAAGGGGMQALHAACCSQGWWDLSLLLLGAVEETGGTLSLDDINYVLAACAAGGAAAEARQAFDKLQQHGLQPCADTYLHLARAQCAAGQWAQAAEAYDNLLHRGIQPGEQLVSLVVDALWCTGLAWAQAQALDIFNSSLSAGWLSPAEVSISRGLLKLNLRAAHLGTGMLRMHRWLLDTRDGIGNSAARCLLDDTKRMCVVSVVDAASSTSGSSSNRGDGGGGEPSPAASQLGASLKGALGPSLLPHHAPFRLTCESGRAQRMESSTMMLKKWLFTESFEEWDRVFSGRAALAAGGGSQSGAGGTELGAHLLFEAQQEEESCQTFAIIREFEAGHRPDPQALLLSSYLHSEGRRRRDLVAAAHQLVQGLGIAAAAQLWHAAVVLLDRCAASGYQPLMDALLAAACVALAADTEGIPLDAARLVDQLDREMTLRMTGLSPEAALQSEVQQAAVVLQGDTACLSAVHCWKVYADRLECDVENEAQTAALMGDSFPRLHELIYEGFYFKYAPSIQAAAVLCVARKQLGVVPCWPSVLSRLTGYQEDVHPEFAAALRELQKTSQYGSTVSQVVYS